MENFSHLGGASEYSYSPANDDDDGLSLVSGSTRDALKVNRLQIGDDSQSTIDDINFDELSLLDVNPEPTRNRQKANNSSNYDHQSHQESNVESSSKFNSVEGEADFEDVLDDLNRELPSHACALRYSFPFIGRQVFDLLQVVL